MKGMSAISKKATLAVLVISSVLLFGSMTAPLLEYISNSFPDITPGSEYSILTVPALVAMFVSFAIGPLALKVNLKYLMVVTALAALAYFLIFALAGDSNFNLLLVGAGIVGVCQGAAMVLTSSILGAYVVDPGQRANFVAISGAIMNGGAAIVNVVGGVIAAGNDGANWPNAYWLGVLIIPALIVFWFLMPKQPDAPEGAPSGLSGEGEPAGSPQSSGGIPFKVWLIIGLGLIVSLGMASFLLNVGKYVVGELQIGTSAEAGIANSLFTIFGVIAGFSFAFVVRGLKNWIAPIGYAIGGVGLAVMVFMNSSIMGIFIGASLCGLGFNIAMPYVMGQMMAITPPRLIPVVMSVNMGIMNLCFFGVPYILGFASAPFGGTIASQLLIGTVLVAIAVVLGILLFVFWKAPAPAAPPAED